MLWLKSWKLPCAKIAIGHKFDSAKTHKITSLFFVINVIVNRAGAARQCDSYELSEHLLKGPLIKRDPTFAKGR